LLAIHPKKIREKEKSTPEMFGPHLTLDLSECNPERLSDLSYIYDLLDELPDVIDMHKITAPYVFVYKPKGNPTEWGISGFVIIAESHISIHTFPDNKLQAIRHTQGCQLHYIEAGGPQGGQETIGKR